MYEITKVADFFDVEEDAFDTVIGSDIKFSGTVNFMKPLMIKGVIDGVINSESEVVIETDASVTADIKAKRILIKGKVMGNIVATELVFITQSGSLNGDVATQDMVMEPGCLFVGRCSMTK